MKKESQRSQDQRWVWLREAAKGLHQLYHLLHQKAQGKPDKKVKVLWVRKLRCTMERWNMSFAVTPVTSATDSLEKHTHQATQNGILIKLGLLKGGNLMNWWMIERGDLLFALKEERTRLKPVSLVNTRTSFWKKMKITIETRSASTFRHWRRRSRIRFVLRIQITLAQGEWSGAKKTKTIFNGCNRRQWGRINQTIGIPSRIQKISQRNRCSTYLKNWCPNNQMRSMEWRQLTGKTLHGSICLWLVMNKSPVLILYCVWVRYTRTLAQTQHGKKDWSSSKVQRNTESWTELMVSQLNSSGISSQDSTRCSSVKKFKSYCWDWMKHQRILLDGSSLCRCSMTSHGDQKTTRENAIQMLNSFLHLQEDSEQDDGHFLVLVQRKSGILSVKIAHKVNGTRWQKNDGDTRRKRTPSPSPLSTGVLKSKGGGQLSIHYCADLKTITTVFRTISSVNQLCLYGAVAEMCEEYESYHAGRPIVWEQSSSSLVPNVINTNVPLNNDDPTHKELLLQRYGERIEKLSQQDKLSNFCTDAGFLTIVEVGQHFMTKDTEGFSQFTDAVACREYTLRRRYIWTEGLDQRKHPNWACIGSYNLLPAR